MLPGHKSEKNLSHHKQKPDISKVEYHSTKNEKKYSNNEKLFDNLNIKGKFILKSYFDEESSIIFLREKYESLKNVILDDTLPEDYKIIKTSNLFLPPTIIIKNITNNDDFVTNLKNKIYCDDPLKISFSNENIINNKSHRTIELKIDSNFSFRYSNKKEKCFC